MNRQQTEEIKGFMQLVILIYRMSDGQQSTPLFLIMRVFTSTYLFLSGFGHFMYYWKTSNYGITRFFEVIIIKKKLLLLLLKF
jgi:N-acetylneuraminate 9-O-acetyltransferase